MILGLDPQPLAVGLISIHGAALIKGALGKMLPAGARADSLASHHPVDGGSGLLRPTGTFHTASVGTTRWRPPPYS